MAAGNCIMKCAFVTVSLLLLISKTNGDEKSNITGKLMKTFRQNAAVANMTIHQLLAKTYFEAIATTPGRLKTLGLHMFNGSFPSDALLLTMNKTTLRDWDVLLQLNNVHKKLADFTPVQFGVTLSMLPATVLNLVKTVNDVATKKNEKPVDLFFNDLQTYGNWSNDDVDKLVAILKVPRSKYDQVKWFPLDDIRDMMSLTSKTIAQKTIVGLMRALCGTGMRYNGSMCVKFAGCKSSSLCISTARCMDIAGSYKCHCIAGYRGDGKDCKQESLQSAENYFAQMQKKFTDIAASRKRNIEVVLLNSWFELVGATAQQLTALNVTVMLLRKPSPSLISLLTNNSIASLRKSYPLITAARPPSFNYTLLDYLFSAIVLDQPNTTVSLLLGLKFPLGNTSLALLLNVSAERINKGNYLTDIYPLIKSNLPILLAKTQAQFYKASVKTPSLDALKAFIGMRTFSNLEKIRSNYINALVNMNSTASVLYSKILYAKLAEATQRPMLLQKLQMTFPMLAKQANISLTQLLKKSWFQIIGIPIPQLRSMGVLPPIFSDRFLHIINTTSIADIETSYSVIQNAPALANKRYNVTLLMYLSTSVFYDSVNATQIILQTMKMATGGIPIAPLLNTTNMALSKRHYLTDVYPLLKKMLPTLIYKTAQHYYETILKMNVSEVQTFAGKNFTNLEVARSKLMHSIIEQDSPAITLSLMGVLTTFLKIYKARVMALPSTPTDLNKAVVNGLVYLSTYAPFGLITKEFKLDGRLVGKGTLVSIANSISKVSKVKFAQIFGMDNQLFGLLNKATLEDIDMILKLDGGNTSVYMLKPIAISGILQKLPKSRSDLFETVGKIANATKTPVKDMTIAKIQKYGKWNESDMNKLLRALGVPREYFNSVRGIAMSSFSEAINSSLSEIARFTVIQMNRVLCSKGKRYDGAQCVAFNGCSLSPSVCGSNARCNDIMGSYLCHCKAGFTGDGKNCSAGPAKTVTYYLQQMQKKFTDIAASRKISVGELLLATWFELVGTTAQHLTELGLTARLPVQPSPALISLLTKNSIASLRKSYPLITTARHKTFNFSLLEYLSDAITFDQPGIKVSVLPHLPLGNTSLALLLNVSADRINKGNYLTDIYPLIKSNLPMLLAKTQEQLYKASFKTLSLDALKAMIGIKMFSDLEKIRFDYASALLDMNHTAIGTYSKMLLLKALEMSAVVVESYSTYTQKTQMTFRMLAVKANTTLPQLLNKTWFEIIGFPLKQLRGMGLIPPVFSSAFLRVMNTTSIAGIDKSYFIIQKATALAKRQYNFAIGTYFATAYYFDTSNATQISLKAILLATGGMPIAPLLNTTDMALSKRHYLTDVYPLLKKMLPTLIKKTAQHYYETILKMNVSEVQTFAGKNFTNLEGARSKLMHSIIELDSPAITLSLMGVLTTFLKIYKARVMALPSTPTDSNKAVVNGLVYLSTYAPFGLITKEFKLDGRLVGKGTLVSIANSISKVSKVKFAQIFGMDNQLFGLLNKAKLEDIDMIFKLDGGNTSVYMLTPVAISGILQKLPKSRSDLFETVGEIANATKRPVKDMTIAKIQKYGKWNDSDVNKLLRVLKVDRNRFSQTKQLQLSAISKVINVSIAGISDFSVIQINRVLCSNGKRFDGMKCVMAFGCRMQSTCDVDARCADLLGYFMCQCKAGFSGNGTSCVPDLPGRAAISATLETNFTAIAASGGMGIEGLLTKTWFEIVGATEQRLIQLGLLAFLPTQPSRALLSLLGNSTLLELQQAFPVLTNAPRLVGKNYDYSPEKFMMAAFELDKPSYYSRVRQMLPFGNKSIAKFLNTTDKAIEKRNFLTDVYVNLKKSLAMILSNTTGDFIEERFKNLSMSTVREVVKMGFYSQLLDSRSKFASAVLDESPAKGALGLQFRNMLRQADKIIADTRTRLSNNTSMTFLQSTAIRQIPVEQLLNMTLLEIIDTTPSIFMALGSMHPMPSKALFSLLQSNSIKRLEKSYGIIANGPVKLTGKNHNYTVADYLSNAVFLDDPSTTQAVLSQMPQVTANASLAGFVNMTKAALERQPYLTGVYPLLKNRIATILNSTAASYYETTYGIPLSSHDANNLPFFMAGNFTRLNTLRMKMAEAIIERNGGLTMTYYMEMQDIFLYTYRNRVKALPSTPSDSNMPVVKGLEYLSNKIKISDIKRIYNIGQSDLEKKTIVNFANTVSQISSQKFAQVFKLSAASLSLMAKANLKDIDVFLRLSKSATTLEQYTPVGLSNFLQANPIKNRRLVDTLQEISSQLKTAVKDLSPSQVQKYGSWSTNDVDTLTSTLGVSRKYYEEMKNMKLSTISTVIHTSETKLATFNVLDLLRALCSSGQRFDGNKCVAFAGCSTATCTPNARCIDVIGSYYCRCKPGFAGNGTICYDACKTKSCPAKAECNNVPGFGAVCKCSGLTQILKNNACVDTKVTVFKVVELKFEETYDQNYKNKASQQFKAKAVELENALYIAICSKIFGCVAIHVKDIRKGSIVVDYDVVVDAAVQNVTVSVVQDASIAALDDPALALFKPNKTSRPKAQTSDICQAGGHNCDKSAKCVPEGTSNYRCECNQGYEMKGGVCKEKEDNVLKIVLPIAIVAVVLIGIILFFIGRKHRKQRNSHDLDYEGKNSYKLNYNPYTQPELGLKNEKFENE